MSGLKTEMHVYCVVLTDNTELPDMIYMVQEIEEEIEHRGPHSP